MARRGDDVSGRRNFPAALSGLAEDGELHHLDYGPDLWTRADRPARAAPQHAGHEAALPSARRQYHRAACFHLQ
jgi:hypothetical protein